VENAIKTGSPAAGGSRRVPAKVDRFGTGPLRSLQIFAAPSAAGHLFFDKLRVGALLAFLVKVLHL